MSHLERVSLIIGALLVGLSTILVVNERKASGRARRANRPPVEKLAKNLQQAWAPYHTP